MPRRRMMDMRNPYGSAGGYVVSSRRRRDRAMQEDMRRGRDRLMMDDMRAYHRGESDYELADLTRQNQEIRHDPYMPRDYETGEVYAGVDDFYDRERRDYERDIARSNYSRGRGRDGHYPMVQGYMPIEAMGRFTGYYGMGEDYARGGRRDYGYDYGYDMRGGRYDYAGDYGESLTKEELESFKKKLLKEVDEKEKQFFTKEQIGQKARQMGIEMKDYNEEELVVTTAMVYTDYCKTAKKYIGSNMDFFIEIARDWLEDKDSALKGGEKLAVYHDCIIMGE